MLLLLRVVARSDIEFALGLIVVDLLHVQLLHELRSLQVGHLGLVARLLGSIGLVLADALLHDAELGLEVAGQQLRVWLDNDEVILEVVVEVLLLHE